MSGAPVVMAPSWIEALGWALVQFLWQGTLIAVLFASLRAALGRWLNADGRYLLACGALAAMAAAPVVTLVAGPRLPAGAPVDRWPVASLLEWQAAMPWLVAAWACGVLVFLVRLLGAWRAAARLRSMSVRPAPAEWHAALAHLARRLRVSRPVRLLVSPLVDVPGVVGWLRPIVLMPVSAVTGLPPEHVAALLAHELAHVRRHDYLVNVLQRSVEALLFYHPRSGGCRDRFAPNARCAATTWPWRRTATRWRTPARSRSSNRPGACWQARRWRPAIRRSSIGSGGSSGRGTRSRTCSRAPARSLR
jgi:beta-lactamase regulating signal transducer with metallopeptidase domain